jgi:hypothetical protein
MLSLDAVLLILALVAFVVAAAGVASRVNLIALGLALWMLSLLI